MIAATHFDLSALRALLQRRLVELDAEIFDNEERAEEGKDLNEVTDRKDEASLRQSGEIDDAQLRRDLSERLQVEAALRRLDLGTYGDCAACGEPIALPRLLVQPAARRCAACQAASEQAGEGAGMRSS